MPASSVPGERASKTQPVPTKPAPFDIQGVRDEDLIDLTPEIHKEAIDIVCALRSRRVVHAAARSAAPSRCPALPAAPVGPERRSIRKPACFMSERSGLPSLVTDPQAVAPWQVYVRFHRCIPQYLSGARGLPLLKPPFGSIVAIDMNTGEHRWRIPVGRGDRMPSCIQQLGVRERLGFPLPQLGAGDQDRPDRRSDGILRSAALRAGVDMPIRDLMISIRICGSTTRPRGKWTVCDRTPANASGRRYHGVAQAIYRIRRWRCTSDRR